MANPQTENGYTQIANEILEKLVNTPLLGSEFRVLFFLLRKTYGYHKKHDRISLTQFQKGTGLSRPTVVKTLKNLMTRKMIIKIWMPDENIGYSFTKNHEDWVVKTHLLVKDTNKFGKGALTETGKGALTYKRKKDNKRNIATSRTPFSLKEEIEKLYESPRRDLNIIGLFLEERETKIANHEQLGLAIKRHVRGAKNLVSYTDNQIIDAMDYAKKEYKDIYTLETLLKILTK